MPDTVIERVNTLGKDQPEQFIFTDRKNRPIGDVPAPGVAPEYPDLLDNNNEDPPAPAENAGVDDDAVIPGVDADPDSEDQAPQINFDDPLPIDDPTTHDEPVVPAPEPPIVDPTPPLVPAAPPEPVPAPEPGPRCSTRTRRAPASYVPSMGGNKYAYAASCLVLWRESCLL